MLDKEPLFSIPAEDLSRQFTRRQFLKLSSAAAGTLVLAGCGPLTAAQGRCSPDLPKNLQPVNINGMLAKSNEVFLTVENTNGALFDNHIRSLALSLREDTNPGIWIGYNRQIADTVGYLSLGVNQGIEKCGPVNGESIRGRVNAIAEHHEFGVVVATDRWIPTDRFGVYMMDRGSTKWTRHLPENKLNGDQSYTVFIDREGVYVGTREGVRRWDGKRWYEESRLMPDVNPQPVHAITKTHTNKIPSDFWIGLLQGGLYRVNPDNPQNNFLFTHENTPGLASNNIRSLEVGNDGKVWAGADPGLSYFDGKWNRIALPNPADDKEVLDIAFDSTGRTWAATDTGLWFLHKDGAKRMTDKKTNGIVFVPAGYAGNKEELGAAATEGHGLYLFKVP